MTMQALLDRIAARAKAADASYEAWEKADAAKAIRTSHGSKAKARARFYRSAEWKSARQECLTRMGAVCAQCGSTERMNVDHIKPRSLFPELALEPANLRPLCWPCNRAKAARWSRHG